MADVHPSLARLEALLVPCWSRQTSSLWSPETPSRGQCSVTALVLQDHFGGDILKTRVGAAWHFYNRIDGVRLDATARQFSASVEYLDVDASREDALEDTTAAQYEELSRRFAAVLQAETRGAPPDGA